VQFHSFTGWGFPITTSSLGISRWKNMQQINDCGHREQVVLLANAQIEQ